MGRLRPPLLATGYAARALPQRGAAARPPRGPRGIGGWSPPLLGLAVPMRRQLRRAKTRRGESTNQALTKLYHKGGLCEHQWCERTWREGELWESERCPRGKCCGGSFHEHDTTAHHMT